MQIFQDNPNQTPEDFYKSLEEKLTEAHSFPEDYLFKFIVPNDKEKLTEVYKIFDGTKNTISTRESKNGKYISISAQVFVLDAAQVIKIYKSAGNIPDIMML
ncbi:DUF493 domain-containing protein [Riemerella columbipharyngis]|uniref:DUF493 domain-containing protein n=1 Tax=Riemerella columbipharyngis TaxID=1071918 RepID=A0A1G6ZLJ1_9FLAO|nr:DUF493 domain-containing protein [Riemerella columbipharyngis]SDE03351.1 hypothetical protein SAMN05421544_102126 [Riemerella columbipharyngis]